MISEISVNKLSLKPLSINDHWNHCQLMTTETTVNWWSLKPLSIDDYHWIYCHRLSNIDFMISQLNFASKGLAEQLNGYLRHLNLIYWQNENLLLS